MNHLEGEDNDMECAKLVELIENADLEARSYSGRGMYGKHCVGYVVEPGEMLASVAKITCAAEEDANTTGEFNDPEKLFRNAKTDDMGRDVIIYFPGVKWED